MGITNPGYPPDEEVATALPASTTAGATSTRGSLVTGRGEFQPAPTRPVESMPASEPRRGDADAII